MRKAGKQEDPTGTISGFPFFLIRNLGASVARWLIFLFISKKDTAQNV